MTGNDDTMKAEDLDHISKNDGKTPTKIGKNFGYEYNINSLQDQWKRMRLLVVLLQQKILKELLLSFPM